MSYLEEVKVTLDLSEATIAALEEAAAEEGTSVEGTIERLVVLDRAAAIADGRKGTRGLSAGELRERLKQESPVASS